MPASDQFAFRNPSRRVIRCAVILAAILLASALAPTLILAHVGIPHGHPPNDAQLGCETMITVALSLAGAALLVALLTIPAARKSDRCLNDFMTGNYLAEWTYAPDEWQTFVAAERRRVYKTEWFIFLLVAGIGVGYGTFIAWVASATTSSKLIHCADVFACAGVFSAIYLLLARVYSRYHRNQLLRFPKAYIGRSAVFCGGAFTFWGADMRQLRSARILEGNQPAIEVVVGYSAAARTTMGVVGAITVAAGGAGYASDQQERLVIPIPRGKEAEARKVVEILLPKPAAPRAPAPGVAPAHHPPAAPPLSPAALALRHRARRAWALTAALFIFGLACFVLVDVFDSGRPANQPQSAKTNTAALLGCGLWLICLVFLLFAIVLTLQARRARKPM